MKHFPKFWFIVITVFLATLVVLFVETRVTTQKNVLAMQFPEFIQGTSEQDAEASALVAAMLNNEAGISAYTQTVFPINLGDVLGAFRTVEDQTEEYIIGSVAVPNYGETYDTHVYVHIDGWILAYYPAEDPASKIIDWKSYDGISIETTKLRSVLFVVASAAGSPLSDVFYYDFRYPNATNMMIVSEHRSANGTDDFGIRLPGNFGYFHRGWHFASVCSGTNASPRLSLNGNQIAQHGCNLSGTTTRESHGVITASALIPDTDHVVSVHQPWTGNAYGSLVIIYRVP